jgi:hypothetical protein
MKKKLFVILLLLYLPVMYLLFIHSCAPRMRFCIDPLQGGARLRLFIGEMSDERPRNERIGYKVIYINSISDEDYRGGFGNELRNGMERGFGKAFTIVHNRDRADVVMACAVRHFYGEYFRTVKAGVWEFGTALLLFIPRLVTDAIPYNTFAGRAAMDVSFVMKDGRKFKRSFDIKIVNSVSTYRRGNYDTAARLSRAASKELNKIVREAFRL